MEIEMRMFFLLITALLTLPANAALNVFACEPEWGALAKELGGNDVTVYTATTAMQDPHHIQARPSLIAKMRQADLVVCTGAELEIGWLPVLLTESGNSKVQPGQTGNFEAARYVSMMEVPARLDRSEGDVHAAGNPHIQTDPRVIARVAGPMAKVMAQLDSARASDYTKREQVFQTRWAQSIKSWEAKAVPLKGVPVAVQHDAFPYLENWLGLKRVAVLEPKPGVEPSVSYLATVLEKLKSNPAKMVIRAAYQPDRSSVWLAERAGVRAVALPFTVGGDAEAGDLYGLYDDTVNRLLAALK
jgi:zinc/manganese transport system substrate-binding protein